MSQSAWPWPQTHLLLVDPDHDRTGGELQFRLTYGGPLLGANRNNTRARHKHEVRRAFHPQLKRLWTVHPFLHEWMEEGMDAILGRRPRKTMRADLADRFVRSGYRFVPLVTRDRELSCSVSILFLRPALPGDIINAGDIDNRLKTLFDSLRLPHNSDELGGYTTPADDENPFFCLLEDDSLITQVSVETDVLLEPVAGGCGANDARLVITISIAPLNITLENMSFIAP